MITAHQDTSSNIPCNPCTITLPTPLVISKPTLGLTTIHYMTTINPKLHYWHHQLVLSWYHHQPESHQQSFKKVSDRHRGP